MKLDGIPTEPPCTSCGDTYCEGPCPQCGGCSCKCEPPIEIALGDEGRCESCGFEVRAGQQIMRYGDDGDIIVLHVQCTVQRGLA